MAATKKSYEVRKNPGSSPIIRGGKKVGEFPNVGYSVQVYGRGSGLAGTLVAAHALAEVMRDVSPYQRRFVLTEAEYEENERVLREWHQALMEKYPFTPGEAKALSESEARYDSLKSRAKEKVRHDLLNLNPYDNFANWRSTPKRRPDIVEPDEISAPKM